MYVHDMPQIFKNFKHITNYTQAQGPFFVLDIVIHRIRVVERFTWRVWLFFVRY